MGLELTRHPATARPDTYALVALMLLNAARLPARADDAGNPLRLDEQEILYIYPQPRDLVCYA